jgi:hypothetical protein
MRDNDIYIYHRKNPGLRFAGLSALRVLACLGAALCLLAFSASARAGSNPGEPDPETPACTGANLRVIEASLSNIVMRQLQLIPSAEGKAAARFLAGHPNKRLAVGVPDYERSKRLGCEYMSDPAMFMAEDPVSGNFQIAHRIFHFCDSDENAFIRSRQVQRDFAYMIAPAFVHEASHARREEELPGTPALMEDELVAFYRSFLFILDALKEVPDFDSIRECLALERQTSSLEERFLRLKESSGKARRAQTQAKMDKLLLEFQSLKSRHSKVVTPLRQDAVKFLIDLAKSNAVFEASIRGTYAGKAGVNSDPRKEILKLKAAVAKLQELDALSSEINARIAGIGGTPEPVNPLSTVAMRLYLGEIEFWKTPDKIRKAREYYGSLLAPLRAEIERRRSLGELKPFLAAPDSLRDPGAGAKS